MYVHNTGIGLWGCVVQVSTVSISLYRIQVLNYGII